MVAPEVDVETLVADLRREAEEIRARVGATSLPPEESREAALRAVSGKAAAASAFGDVRLLGADRLTNLTALADPGDVDFHSHRVRLGRAIVAAKRVLRRLLTPVLDRQAAYNRAVVQALAAFEDQVGSRLQGIERRLIALEESVSNALGTAALGGAPFDYTAFEDAFRGPREAVRAHVRRYLEYFPTAGAGPVVDLGCGRGEFLELLAEAGVAAWGVDHDERRVAECRVRSLDVRHGELLRALEGVADATLGGVVSFQVVEHLPLSKTVHLLEVARRKLRPGGCLIVETVNVQSLITHARSWTLDPSHRQPLHPLTLRFLVDRTGFTRSELVYSGDVEPETRLEGERGADAAARNAARLNALVYGPQDYAVVAWA
jgi:SAM-dependent methyltransferase